MYTYLEQMLAELGDKAQLLIYVDGEDLRGFVHEQIGSERFELLSFAVGQCRLAALLGELDKQAEEWLSEQKS